MEDLLKRRIIIFVFIIVCFLAFSKEKDIPYKSSFKVNDVYDENDQRKFKVIKETQEIANDQEIKNLPESDIIGIASCFDKYRIRFDILIVKDISLKFNSWFSFELESREHTEKYTYYILSGELEYQKIENGKVTEKKKLGLRNSKDWAGIIRSGKNKLASVYLIIDKDVHFGGQRGTKYFLTSTFSTGYVDRTKKLKLSDRTLPIDIEFVR